jgi:hypothetical protein
MEQEDPCYGRIFVCGKEGIREESLHFSPQAREVLLNRRRLNPGGETPSQSQLSNPKENFQRKHNQDLERMEMALSNLQRKSIGLITAATITFTCGFLGGLIAGAAANNCLYTIAPISATAFRFRAGILWLLPYVLISHAAFHNGVAFGMAMREYTPPEVYIQ